MSFTALDIFLIATIVDMYLQATVAALGFLSDNKRIYSARPILVSETCKTENADRHAQLIDLLVKASNMELLSHRLVSIVSDGGTWRGGVLTQLTLCSELSDTSPIYPLLHPLEFMNLHVGTDDITADKDFCHVFKRIRNLLLCQRSIVVCGQLITTPMLRKHLRDDGRNCSEAHLNSMFQPDDKQDHVPNAYTTLSEISTLPSTVSTQPAYSDSR
jgi:hypothetical protein